MIYTFDDLKRFHRSGAALRHLQAALAISRKEHGEVEDNIGKSTSTQPPAEALPIGDAPTSGPEPGRTSSHADEILSATDFNKCLEFGLEPADVTKLVKHGVRPDDAINAGLRHITSSEGALRLDRVDTGELAGTLIPYRDCPAGVLHCRIVLHRPVRLWGHAVSILQPTRSTNHLFYVPGMTDEQLNAPAIPILLCDSEPSALSALQLVQQAEGTPSILPVGIGGAWGWRMSETVNDDAGTTKTQSGPVAGLQDKIAREGRHIILAYGSEVASDSDAAAARAALTRFLKKQKAKVSILKVPPGPNGACQDLGERIAAVGPGPVLEAIGQLSDPTKSTGPKASGFVVTDDQIYSLSAKGERLFLASHFKVISKTREIDGTNWGLLFEIRSPDGCIQKVVIPNHYLADGGTELARFLHSYGVVVNPNRIAKERVRIPKV